MSSIPLTPAAESAAGSANGEAARLELARQAAGAVPDPEIPAVTLADLGILRGVDLVGGQVVVRLTPTYTGCPATLPIRLSVETALIAAGIADARIETVLAPAWSTDDISEEGRRKLAAIGIAPPVRRGGKQALFGADEVACPRCGSSDTERISEFGATPCKALWRCLECREPFDHFKCI